MSSNSGPSAAEEQLAGGSVTSSLHAAAAASLPHLAGLGKKKRVLGQPSSRRGGHITPGGTLHGAAEGANISSSRDASEEDNDEASGFSDSASSLRQHPVTANTSLPTTARDKALVDSKEAHRRPSNPALDHAKGILDGPTPEMGSTARFANSSEASSGASGLPGMSRREPAPSLGILPDTGLPSTAADTPRPLDQPSAPINVPQPASRRKGNSPILSHMPAVVENAKDGNGAKRGTGLDSDAYDEEDNMDSTAANPYDGDVEYAARTPVSQQIVAGAGGTLMSTGHSSNAQSSFATSPALQAATGTSAVTALPPSVNFTAPVDVPSRPFIATEKPSALADPESHHADVPLIAKEVPVPVASPDDIRGFIHKAIYEPDPKRTYRINLPADGGRNPARPIRIYADGVYDLFHYAHALQLRQAKLMFPCVHLLVGVVSSQNCANHKNEPVMTSTERYTAVRNCKWVDEVVEDAPWVITQELIDKLGIDYVAHDELPYAGAGNSAAMSDVYQFVKDQGRFLPTQRTEGVSTSELLARIVEQYRNHNYDKKLEKIGHKELAFE